MLPFKCCKSIQNGNEQQRVYLRLSRGKILRWAKYDIQNNTNYKT